MNTTYIQKKRREWKDRIKSAEKKKTKRNKDYNEVKEKKYMKK